MKLEEKYKTTFNTWNKIGKLYEKTFMDVDLYNDSYDAFCDGVGVDVPKILEIGCGPGNITRYLLCERPDFDVLGTDISPRMLDLAQMNNLVANFLELDCRNLNELTDKYDGIICGFTIPYLAKDDCSKMIHDCAQLLNENGLFYLSFIEGNYRQSGVETGSTGDQVYVYYYSKRIIKKMLTESGLEIKETFIKFYDQRGKTQNHVIFIAKRG